MANNDKVSDIQKQASKIVVEAYKKGGRVYYKDVKHIVTADINSINNVLRNYGKLNVLLIDGSWNSFDIDYSGMNLKGKDIPEIFKKKKTGSLGQDMDRHLHWSICIFRNTINIMDSRKDRIIEINPILYPFDFSMK